MKTKYAICVILFNPKLIELERLTNLIIDNVCLYIYDNSATSNEIQISKILHRDVFQYFYNGQNDGIASAYNSVARKAYYIDKCDYLLCLDQDSKISKSSLEQFLRASRQAFQDEVAMVAVNTGYSSSVVSDKLKQSVKFAITSGSMLNLKIFLELKGFDENLFIDGVDRDYCLTLREHHLLIIQINYIKMDHTLGVGTQNFMGLYEHSIERNYYIHRNRLYVVDKHKKMFHGFVLFRAKYLSTLKQIMSIIFCERDKWKKLLAMVKGTIDFSRKHFGKE